jgi:hypothetical protein
MSGNMSAKIIALLIAAFACASAAFAQGSGNRDNGRTSQTAQYCVPQHDSADALRIYC